LELDGQHLGIENRVMNVHDGSAAVMNMGAGYGRFRLSLADNRHSPHNRHPKSSYKVSVAAPHMQLPLSFISQEKDEITEIH